MENTMTDPTAWFAGASLLLSLGCFLARFRLGRRVGDGSERRIETVLGAIGILAFGLGMGTLTTALQGREEADPGDYALVLQTISVERRAAPDFLSIMRDGRMTRDEFLDFRSKWPIASVGDERSVAARVARGMTFRR